MNEERFLTNFFEISSTKRHTSFGIIASVVLAAISFEEGGSGLLAHPARRRRATDEGVYAFDPPLFRRKQKREIIRSGGPNKRVRDALILFFYNRQRERTEGTLEKMRSRLNIYIYMYMYT